MFSTANHAVVDFTVVGKADGFFDEAAQQLVINETGYSGDLRVVVPTGVTFFGRAQNGNLFDLAMRLNVSSPNGAVNVS